MSVLLLAIGSRGDVAPMAALAGGLERAGVRARVVALAEFADLVRDAGAEIVPVAASLADAFRGTEVEGLRARFAQTPLGQALLLRGWVDRLAQPLADAVAGAAGEGETVLTGVLTRDVATALAESRGARPVTVLFTGQLPTAHAQSHHQFQRFRSRAAYNRWGGRLAWQAATGLGIAAGRATRSRLGLARLPGRRIAAAADRFPTMIAASSLVVPPAPDWPASTMQTGYPFAPMQGFQPDEALRAFLEDGDLPVFVGFGSMQPLLRAQPDLVERAAELSGRRIVTPDAARPGLRGASVLATGDVPHDWLLPRMAAVIHHGGAGTTHAGLRSGRPSAAVPFGVDQPYHAHRLRVLGVSPPPIPALRLDPAGLAGVITDLLDGPGAAGYAARAAELGEALRAEDGVGNAVGAMDRLGLL